MDQYDLSGRTALVTGASSGIGRETAVLLAAHGAFVGLHCHTGVTRAQAVLAEIQQNGGRGLVLQADLTDEGQANSMVDQLVGTVGRLDILVNNAGTAVQRVKIEDCPLDVWKKALDANLNSAFLVSKRAIPHLRRSGHGAIVNNLSLSVQTGGAHGAGPYAAAKGALQILTRTLARELAPEVRTNSIMPGVIETPHHEQFSTPERMAIYAAETPLKRNGKPAEVAQVILFLVSDAASFVNGATVDISGGRFLR